MFLVLSIFLFKVYSSIYGMSVRIVVWVVMVSMVSVRGVAMVYRWLVRVWYMV